MKQGNCGEGRLLVRRVGTAAAIALGVLVIAAPAAPAAVDDTILVSRADGPNGAGGESFSADASISDDGCQIAWNTTADNLAATDPTAGQNVVTRDACTGVTEPVALDDVGDTPANEFNSTATVSGNGCRIAFWTTDSLHPDDPDTLEENAPNFVTHAWSEGSVYVRDICTDDTILVSRDENGVSRPVTQGQTSISADGNLVAFASAAHFDVQGAVPDGNPANPTPPADRDVYVRDISGAHTRLASLNAAGTAGANGDNLTQTEARQALSDDGRFLSMYTTSTDMAGPGSGPPDTNGREDIYVRDLQTGVAERATLTDLDGQLTAPPGTQITPFTWAISGDGRHIAWASNSPELGGNGFVQVWLRDLDADTTELISRASGPEGDIAVDPGAGRPALDESGRLVAFASGATNLATNVNGFQVYVRDTLNQTTHAASRKSGHLGELSTGAIATEDIAFSDDSRFLAMVSTSPDLAPGDANGGDQDVFRRELGEPPPPRTSQSFNVRPIAGDVTVNLPGPGGVQPLGTSRQLPVGTVVDATAGRAAVTTTGTGQRKPVQTAEFYGDRFVVTQNSSTLATMKLTKPRCKGAKKRGKGRKGKKGRKGAAARSAAGGPVALASRGRGLWGSGRGRFRTRGGRGAGTVRGTVWFVQDRCNGSTLLKVQQGVVAVDDFGRKGKVNRVLNAGQSYVAKAKPKRKKRG